MGFSKPLLALMLLSGPENFMDDLLLRIKSDAEFTPTGRSPRTQPTNSRMLSDAHFQQFLTLLWRIFFCKTTNTKEILLSEGLRSRQVQNVGFERFKERLKTLVKSRTKMLRAESAGKSREETRTRARPDSTCWRTQAAFSTRTPHQGRHLGTHCNSSFLRSKLHGI